MKFTTYGFAVAVLSLNVAGKLLPARSDPPARNVKDLSARGNVLARQSYDYCGATSYYCTDSNCCGINTFNCMPAGAECCAALSDYGFGLWCAPGTTCVVVSGYIQCQNESGDYYSADSSAAEEATSTSAHAGATTEPPASTKTNTSKKTKSKAWIAGAVAGPLLGIAIIAGVVFFLFMLRKKKRTNASANAAIIANHQQGGGPGAQPMMTTAPPPMGPAPLPHDPDLKTHAYVQQYEVPTPISSPPPQWTPASPAPTSISPAPVTVAPVPVHPPQASTEVHGIASPVSPMNTGNGVYSPPVQNPRPVYGNAMELPTGPTSQPPRHGAHEMYG